MKIGIVAVGKLKTGPLWDLYHDYEKRLQWTVILEEIENYGSLNHREQRQRETQTLLTKIPESMVPVFLDSRGKTFSSKEFAGFLDNLAVINQKPAFVIGGAEGIDREFCPKTCPWLSFGPATWPHLLARVMLMEQLYRAQEILGGKKYHRS